MTYYLGSQGSQKPWRVPFQILPVKKVPRTILGWKTQFLMLNFVSNIPNLSFNWKQNITAIVSFCGHFILKNMKWVGLKTVPKFLHVFIAQWPGRKPFFRVFNFKKVVSFRFFQGCFLYVTRKMIQLKLKSKKAALPDFKNYHILYKI